MKLSWLLIFILPILLLLTSCNREQEDVLSSSIFFNKVTISKGTYLPQYELKDKIVRYRKAHFKVCLNDPVSKKPIAHYGFKASLTLKQAKPAIVIDQKITNFNQRFEPLLTDSSGCLEFYKIIQFNTTNYSDWSRYLLTIKDGGAGIYKDNTMTRNVCVNGRINNEDFGIDSDAPGNSCPEAEASSPQLYISDVEYKYLENVTNSVKLNKHMHLALKKRVEITLKPRMLVANDFNGKESDRSVHKGKYHIKVLFFTPKKAGALFDKQDLINSSSSDFEFLTGAISTDAQKIRNGEVVFNIDLPILYGDYSKMMTRGRILIEMYPSQDKLRHKSHQISYLPAISIANFTGVDNSKQTIRTFITDSEQKQKVVNQISDYMTHFIKTKIKTLEPDTNLESPRKMYSEFLNLDLKRNNIRSKVVEWSIDKFNSKLEPVYKVLDTKIFNASKSHADYKLSAKDVDAIVSLDPSKSDASVSLNTLQAKFCKLFDKRPIQLIFHHTSYTGRYKKCLENPSKFLNISATKHIEKIHSIKKVVEDRPRYLNTGDSYMANASRQALIENGTRLVKGLTLVGATASLSKALRKLPSLVGSLTGGILGTYDVYTTESQLESLGETSRIFQGITLRYDVSGLYIKFQADTASCVYVSKKTKPKVKNSSSRWYRRTYAKPEKPNNIYKICIENKAEQLTEKWHFIHDTNRSKNNGMFKDPYAVDAVSSKVIRGEAVFFDFRRRCEDKKKKVVFKMARNNELANNYIEAYGGTNKSTIKSLKEHNDNSFPGLFIPFIGSMSPESL